MGGPRASTVRRIYAGAICALCETTLPERTDGRSGERVCETCRPGGFHRICMNFQTCREGWRITFLEQDCRTSLGRTLHLRKWVRVEEMVRRTQQPIAALEELQHQKDTWGRGSVWLLLLTEQYGRLKG